MNSSEEKVFLNDLKVGDLVLGSRDSVIANALLFVLGKNKKTKELDCVRFYKGVWKHTHYKYEESTFLFARKLNK